MGFDAIGTHAIAEMILASSGASVFPPVVYLSVSRPTNQLSARWFKKRADYVSPTEGSPVLWDDDTNILWDDDTNILWDE